MWIQSQGMSEAVGHLKALLASASGRSSATTHVCYAFLFGITYMYATI